MFHYNIKKKYGDINDIIDDYSNGTIQLRGNKTQEIQEIQSYINDILFQQPLRDFPGQFVVGYVISIVIYVLLALVYYIVLHPWKNIFLIKKSSEPTENVDREDLPQQDNDEPSEGEEITHL